MTVSQTMSVPTSDGGSVTVSVSGWDNPPPAPPPPTIVGLDDPTPDAGLAPYVGAQRLFAGPALPDCTKLPARVLAMPSMPMRAAARPAATAMQAMLLSRPVGVFIPNHEKNRPGKPPPAECKDNMLWCRDQIDTANATGRTHWLLAENFDCYPYQNGGAGFAEYIATDSAGNVVADLITWDIYAPLNGAKLVTLDYLMQPYRDSRAAFPHIRGGLLELDVMARATGTPPTRTTATHQDAADLLGDAIDEVKADGGFVVCVWGTTGDQVDKVTGKTIDYTLAPGSPEYVIVRDRMRTQ